MFIYLIVCLIMIRFFKIFLVKTHIPQKFLKVLVTFWYFWTPADSTLFYTLSAVYQFVKAFISLRWCFVLQQHLCFESLFHFLILRTYFQILAVNGQDVTSSMQEDVAAKLKVIIKYLHANYITITPLENCQSAVYEFVKSSFQLHYLECCTKKMRILKMMNK